MFGSREGFEGVLIGCRGVCDWVRCAGGMQQSGTFFASYR